MSTVISHNLKFSFTFVHITNNSVQYGHDMQIINKIDTDALVVLAEIDSLESSPIRTFKYYDQTWAIRTPSESHSQRGGRNERFARSSRAWPPLLAVRLFSTHAGEGMLVEFKPPRHQ